MKQLIAFLALVLATTSTLTFSQESERDVKRADRKAQRDARIAKMKAEEQAYGAICYEEAIQALKEKQFVLEADQVIFRNGQSVFVSATTNFVLMNGSRATVQIAFNTPYPGPNGIGGVTVDGTASDMEMTTGKQGNVNCNFNVQGIGISAHVFISLTNGGNNATVTVNPNFSSNTLTLNGNLVPLKKSDVFKGRSW